MVGENLMGCVGINIMPPAAPVISTLAGHELAAIPGGFGVIGSAEFEDATPHWIYTEPFRLGTTAVSEDQYRSVMEKPGCRDAPGNHPVTVVSYGDALEYLKRRGGGLTLPPEQKWEYAARGPAVNIRAMMEEQGLRVDPEEIAAFIEGRYENLVFGVMGQIFNDPKEGIFKRLLSEGQPFFGWRVYATPSGKLTREEVWFDKGEKGTTDVSFGPASAYGLKCMAGDVWEWMADWYSEDAYRLGGVNPAGPENGESRSVRGGSWVDGGPRVLRAGGRVYDLADVRYGNLGFRVFAPQGS